SRAVRRWRIASCMIVVFKRTRLPTQGVTSASSVACSTKIRLSILPRAVRRLDVKPISGFRTRRKNMRFMVIVKANKESEAGRIPNERELASMGKFNDELIKAGIMLAGEGLHPSSKGARVKFEGKKRTVVDGPFAEAR